jgi:hypothetical protein
LMSTIFIFIVVSLSYFVKYPVIETRHWQTKDCAYRSCVYANAFNFVRTVQLH